MTAEDDGLVVSAEETAGTEQQNAAEQNKTETKREASPKGHLSKEDWTALGRREEDWQSPEEYTGRQSALKKSVRDLEARLAEKEKHLDRIEVVTKKALQRIRDKDVADLQKRQFEAAAIADVETVAKLRGEEETLRRSYAEEDRQTQAPGLLPETTAWMQRNPLFQRDPVWTERALNVYNQAERLAPLASEAEKLAYVDRQMGDASSAPVRQASGMPDVQGGGRQAAPAKKHSAATLPADAVKEGTKYVKMGLFKNLEEYAKDYYEDA
jgi:hypothetical protein